MFTAFINILLDPIFIYVLGLGVGGAAAATVLAGAIPMFIMMYWMFIKQDSFLKVKMSEYKRDLNIYKDILVVGIPASLEQFILSFFSILINYWLTIIAGTVAVAVYSATWRLVAIGLAPLIGIGISALTVGGAAYGARNLTNFKIALNYGVKLGLISSAIICSMLFIFAEPLSFIFSYSADSSVLAPKIVEALHILSFFLLLVPFGILSGNLFQAMGKGTISLALTIFRAFLLELVFAGLFAFVLNWGAPGIYAGTVVGMAIGSIVAYIFINYYLNKHKSYFNS
jgi:Na+-driven multidrug efflux pump